MSEPKNLTAADLVHTLNDVSTRAGKIVASMNLMRSPRLDTLNAGYAAAVRTADPSVIAKMETVVVDGIMKLAQDLSEDQLTASEIIGINDTAQDASTEPLSGGLCGGGRGLSGIRPEKVAAGIRMNAQRADALMRLAVTDAQKWNRTSMNMYKILGGYEQQRAEFLPVMTSTHLHQDKFLTDVAKDSVFATTLSNSLLGSDDVLTFNVIPSTLGAPVGETIA